MSRGTERGNINQEKCVVGKGSYLWNSNDLGARTRSLGTALSTAMRFQVWRSALVRLDKKKAMEFSRMD